jgi:hypothetical protein
MDIQTYISHIKFRWIRPHTPVLSIAFDQLAQHLKLSVLFEIHNTTLPGNNQHSEQHLRDLCFIPKMSTYAIGAIINHAVRLMPQKHAYVNVGVWNGFSLLAGMARNQEKLCIGVDNFSEFGGPKRAFQKRFSQLGSAKHHFFEMDYVDYFNNTHDAPIGVYLYDGNHSYPDQLRALQLAEPFFSDNCIVLVDDANYPAVKQATFDFIKGSSHSYQMISHRSTFCNHHPTFWNGLMVFRRT